MTDPVKDLVAYLSGEPGGAGDRCRRALADPASDLSHFLTAARERTRAAIAEPAFRGLGLSPAACMPADAEPSAADLEDRYDRRWLPWLFANVAILMAVLMAWAPWRAGAGPRAEDQAKAPGPVVAAGPAPALGDLRLDQPGQFPRGEARVGADLAAANKPGGAGPDSSQIAGKAGGQFGPAPVPDAPTGPAPPAGLPIKIPDMVPPQPAQPGPPGDEAKVMAKKLKAALDQVKDLQHDNDLLKQTIADLQAQVNKLNQDLLQAVRSLADCRNGAAAQQKVIDAQQARIDAMKPLADENARLRVRVKELEAALKVPPGIDPTKPKPGVPDPKKKP
jgi:hypothetical protein